MDYFSLSSLPYLLVYVLPVFLIGIFVNSISDPRGLYQTMGLRPPQKEPICPFVYSFGVRELSASLALAALIAYDEWRAVTIRLSCIGINGTGDFLLGGWQGMGWWHAFKFHGLPTLAGHLGCMESAARDIKLQ